MKYRNRTVITAQILEIAASGPVTKTVIMYKAFLSYIQLKEYLSTLMENGLIKHIPANDKYITTEKGLKVLKMMDELSRLTNSKPSQIQS